MGGPGSSLSKMKSQKKYCNVTFFTVILTLPTLYYLQLYKISFSSSFQIWILITPKIKFHHKFNKRQLNQILVSLNISVGKIVSFAAKLQISNL